MVFLVVPSSTNSILGGNHIQMLGEKWEKKKRVVLAYFFLNSKVITLWCEKKLTNLRILWENMNDFHMISRAKL